jgi:pimeloyl-ACP methyl ester carboxylesterase
VLLADLRGHGDSEGTLSTYGVLEAADAAVWQRWLTERGARGVFGFGASLGAAVLLQAPRAGAKFDGVVAEASYSGFTQVALDRIGAKAGALSWLARLLARPIVASGVLYARLRYCIDLGQASPQHAAGATSTPWLLMHGDADVETPPSHSIAIRDANPGHTELWLVPGAGHCGAWRQAPEEFERRVIEWMEAQEPK